MVTITSAAWTTSSVSGLGKASVSSIPRSARAWMTRGWIARVGCEPAERTWTLPADRCLANAAAIWERPALWTQTNRISGVLVATSVSYTHLRAHETVLDLVCRLLL